MIDEKFINSICELIATRTPFSFDDVKWQYDRLKSFDLLIASCNHAAIHGTELYRSVNAVLAVK